MTFTAPLGLLALLLLPVVVALHLFRNRLPERLVTALFLFPVTPVLADGGRTRTRLLSSPSFWLECLFVLLSALWLSGFTLASLRPRHVVVVLDDSASMAASGTRARVQQTIGNLLDELRAHDEVTLVRTGTEAQVVLGPRAVVAELAAAVAMWRPTQPGHAQQPALDLARELAGHSGDVLYCTDEHPGFPVDDMRVVACGEALANAALLSVRQLRSPESERLLVSMIAFGDVGSSELRVFAGERELLRVPVSFPNTGGDAELLLPVPRGSERLRVELADDALAIDNVAWLLPEPERTVAVCDQLSDPQQQQFRLADVFAALRDWRSEPDPTQAQVILRAQPGKLLAGQLEVVLASTAGDKLAHRSPFVVDRAHVLLQGLPLDGIAWQSGSGDLPGQVLVASGSKVLCSEQLLAVGRRLWLDVDASAGNLVRAPDWPILFANVLAAARLEAPGCRSQRVRIGEELAYRSGEVHEPVVIVDPLGAVVKSDELGHVACIAAEPGVYRVQTQRGRLLAEVAARFVDASESDLLRRVAFDRQPIVATRATSSARQDPGPMRRWLAVLLLLVVMADWWWLHRQGT